MFQVSVKTADILKAGRT